MLLHALNLLMSQNPRSPTTEVPKNLNFYVVNKGFFFVLNTSQALQGTIIQLHNIISYFFMTKVFGHLSATFFAIPFNFMEINPYHHHIGCACVCVE